MKLASSFYCGKLITHKNQAKKWKEFNIFKNYSIQYRKPPLVTLPASDISDLSACFNSLEKQTNVEIFNNSQCYHFSINILPNHSPVYIYSAFPFKNMPLLPLCVPVFIYYGPEGSAWEKNSQFTPVLSGLFVSEGKEGEEDRGEKVTAGQGEQG